jgi:hypothetical protein
MNQLIEYIKKHGPIGIYNMGWESIKYARSLVGEVKINSNWLNYRSMQPIVYDPPDIMTKTSYKNCIDVALRVEDDQLILHIILWHGDSYHGERESLDCEFNVYLHAIPAIFIPSIEQHTERVAERQLSHERDMKWERKIKNRAKKLLTL